MSCDCGHEKVELPPTCSGACACHRTALAAIPNPLNAGQILQFYSTGHQNLGVRPRKINATEAVSLSDRQVDLQKHGFILLDSPLVALKLKGQVQVIAVSKFQNEKKEYYVAKVSPGFGLDFAAEPGSQPIRITTQFPVLAGTGDGENWGWIYELTRATNNPNDPSTKILEHHIGDKCGQAKSLNPEESARKTQLAAFYDGRPRVSDRYVVYQSPKKEICYKAMSKTTSTTVRSEKSKFVALEGSPLAACTLEGEYFIFFVGGGFDKMEEGMHFIWVLNKEIGEADQQPERVNVTGTDNPFTIALGAYLAVTPSPNLSTGLFDIHIFCFDEADGGKRCIAHTVYETKIPVPPQKSI